MVSGQWSGVSGQGPVLKYVYTKMSKKRSFKPVIRYSQAFKISVVREVEEDGLTRSEVAAKYSIKGSGTVNNWLSQFGGGKIGRIIRVERPKEINELQKLRERIKRLESGLCDAHLELAITNGYLKIACERAGIEDLEEFKKKQNTIAPGRF